MLSSWNSINSHEWIHLNLQMIHSLERQFVRIRIHCNHNLKKRRNGCFLHEIESFDETKNRWKATKKRIQRSSSFVSRRTKKKKSDDMLPQWKRSFHNEWSLKVSQGTQHPEGGCAGCWPSCTMAQTVPSADMIWRDQLGARSGSWNSI